MIPLNLNDLIDYLGKHNYDPHLQTETNQIYIIIKVAQKEFPLFLRIYEKSALLQLLVFIPTKIKAGTHEDLSRLLHKMNAELDLPGFGMDETANVVFYRLMLPSLNNEISEVLLEAFLKSISRICETISAPIVAVANGMTTYAELVQKAKEQKNKQNIFKP